MKYATLRGLQRNAAVVLVNRSSVAHTAGDDSTDRR
jgi:hypothetical protein